MSTAQQLGLIGNSVKVQSLPTASVETFGAGNRFYTLIGQQEGYITGHTYRTVVANDVYSWEDVAGGDYNMLDNIPVINQDLAATGFTPAANTYYRHTGATTDTFTQGVIYLYDTAYHKLGESAGISDVKVNGASVVANGVANIPTASRSVPGVIDLSSQTFAGAKTFNTLIAKDFRYRAIYGDIVFLSGGSGAGSTGIGLKPYNSSYSADYYFYGKGNNASYIILRPENDDGIFLYNANGNKRALLASAWSNAVSNSATLSKSGLYDIKATIDGAVFSTVINWDGSSVCRSASLSIKDANTQALVSLYYEVSATGVLSLNKIDNTGNVTVDTTTTISYRRIGLA